MGLLPDDPPDIWKDKLDKLEGLEDSSEIMLVGHNPFMTVLSALLWTMGRLSVFRLLMQLVLKKPIKGGICVGFASLSLFIFKSYLKMIENYSRWKNYE